MNYNLIIPDNYKRQPLKGKIEWLEALRSGKYKQGIDYLNDGDSYCCLGVLCKINNFLNDFGEDVHGGDDKEGQLSKGNPFFKYLKELGELPEVVEVLYKASIISLLSRATSLATLNDYGLSFNDIADVIDKVWYDEDKEQP